MFSEYQPTGQILAWAAILSCARFENQRWLRARQAGMRGSNETFGMLVDATYLIGTSVGLLALALSLYDFGWKRTLGLFVSTMLIGWLWGAVGAFAGTLISSLALWMIGTALVYVAAIPLLWQFSWFGLLR